MILLKDSVGSGPGYLSVPSLLVCSLGGVCVSLCFDQLCISVMIFISNFFSCLVAIMKTFYKVLLMRCKHGVFTAIFRKTKQT